MATIDELGAPPTPQPAQGGGGFDVKQLLSLLPMLAALKSGGAAGAGGFAQGWTQGRTYLDEQKRRDAILAQQQQDRQAEIARQEAETQDRKKKEAFDLLLKLGPHVGETVLSQMDNTPDLDPTAVAGQEAQKYADLIGRLLPNSGIQAGDIQTMIPDVKTAYSGRVTKHAQEVLNNLKGYSTKDLRAMGAKIPFMGRAVTYDELLAKAGQPEGLTPESEQPKPQEPAKVGTFEDYVQRTYGANPTPDQILKARKAYQQADDRPVDPNIAALREIAIQNARANLGALPPRLRTSVDSTVRAFDNNPLVKRVQTQSEAVSFIDSLPADTKNPSDDQALIYAFAKAMDPDSVVREGEYATAQKYAQSWVKAYGKGVEMAIAGTGFLSQEARTNMKATIKKKFAAGQAQYNNLRQEYGKRINRQTGRGDGDTYLTDYGAAFPGTAREPNQTPSAPTTGPTVGSVVTLKDGRKVKVTGLNPDGSIKGTVVR